MYLQRENINFIGIKGIKRFVGSKYPQYTFPTSDYFENCNPTNENYDLQEFTIKPTTFTNSSLSPFPKDTQVDTNIF